MKKINSILAQRLRDSFPILVDFDNATLCSAVANLHYEIIIEIIRAAEEKLGNFKDLTVNNPRTKKTALLEIVGVELSERVFDTPAAVGPIYQLVHYIQANKFAFGVNAEEERAERRAETAAGYGRGSKGILIDDADEFDLICIAMGFNSNNLSRQEEDEAMLRAGYIK